MVCSYTGILLSKANEQIIGTHKLDKPSNHTIEQNIYNTKENYYYTSIYIKFRERHTYRGR